MTLVRDRIAHTPVAVEITHGMTEQLYGRDLVLEDISRSAVVLGDARKAHHQVTLDRIACKNVPQFVQGQDGSSAMFAVKGSAKPFIEEHLTIGLEIGPDGRERGVQVRHRERAGAGKAVVSDIPALPPMQQWANVHTLGVKGDGSDDTAALQAAIDSHRVLYFPSGTYRVTKHTATEAGQRVDRLQSRDHGDCGNGRSGEVHGRRRSGAAGRERKGRLGHYDRNRNPDLANGPSRSGSGVARGAGLHG